MARKANPENVYAMTCKVTGATIKTNPKQFNADCARYGITREEMSASYVSRAGRKILTDEKLSPEDAATKYGLHMNVANKLKATVKPQPIVVTVPVTAVTEATPVTTEPEPMQTTGEVVYDASKDEDEVSTPETTLA